MKHRNYEKQRSKDWIWGLGLEFCEYDRKQFGTELNGIE